MYGLSSTSVTRLGICFGSASVVNSTYFGLPVGSARLIRSDSAQPTHGSTQRNR